ncbi:Copia protein, partial [Mucuna pruriens]
MKIYHLEQQILGNVEDRLITRSTFKDQAQMALLVEIKPKNKLVSPPNDKSIIGRKWIFRNKLDENDDIIIGAIDDSFCEEFFELMHKEFEMSMMRELKFFLGLQIKQAEDEIYIHQTKYLKELLKKLNLEDCKTMPTPMHPTLILSLDEIDKKIPKRLKDYSDVDFAGDRIERKDISGGCHFIRTNLKFICCICKELAVHRLTQRSKDIPIFHSGTQHLKDTPNIHSRTQHPMGTPNVHIGT